MVETKECRLCNEEKSILEFNIDKDSKDGADSRCKPCFRKYRRGLDTKRSDRWRKVYNCPDVSVYCFTYNDEIVYIGSSEITPFRLKEHYVGIRSFSKRKEMNRLQFEKDFRWKILFTCDNYEDVKHFEKVMIKYYEPKFNKIKYKSYNG